MKQLSDAILMILVSALALAFGSEVVMAQNSSAEPEIIPANAERCQRNTINIANLKEIARIKEQKIFVIAHLGTGEQSPNLNRRRLKDIGAEFDQVSPMSREKLILAEGERVKGLARVDVYLGSELYFMSYIPKNGNFCSLCCDRRGEFYGSLNRRRIRKKSR